MPKNDGSCTCHQMKQKGTFDGGRFFMSRFHYLHVEKILRTCFLERMMSIEDDSTHFERFRGPLGLRRMPPNVLPGHIRILCILEKSCFLTILLMKLAGFHVFFLQTVLWSCRNCSLKCVDTICWQNFPKLGDKSQLMICSRKNVLRACRT